MKLLITAREEGLDAPIDPRFGRGAYYCVVDSASLTCETYPNPALNAPGGAGVQAAQYAEELMVNAVISGHFGPKAADVLQAAKITMYLLGDTQTVRQAVERLNAGELQSFGGSDPSEPSEG